jgi:hypothetical protein
MHPSFIMFVGTIHDMILNRTEEDVAEALTQRGVEKSDIVLSFIPERVRQHTGLRKGIRLLIRYIKENEVADFFLIKKSRRNVR